MAYDRADWHYGGKFPEGLPPECGGTHIGMFLAWAIINGLEGELHRENSISSIQAVRDRRMTGREFLFKECDEKFWEEDLNDKGNAFAKHYYETDIYINDYSEVLGTDVPSLYHVADTWESCDRIAKVINRRYEEWKRTQ